MIKLPPPTFKVSDVLPRCSSSYEDTDKITALNALAGELTTREADYGNKASRQKLFEINPEPSIAGIEREELEDLYKSKLVKHPSARPYYDAILLSPAHKTCPICTIGTVSTLDHYLASSKFPAFSITPINLVPSCIDCNKTKSAKLVTELNKQTLHPYFDDLKGVKWLTAKVVESDPPAVIFDVLSNIPPCAVEIDRIKHHFQLFGLDRLYTANAGGMLCAIADLSAKWASLGGEEKVHQNLQMNAESACLSDPNDWRGVMYEALARSEWFWRGGYKLVKKIEHVAAAVTIGP